MSPLRILILGILFYILYRLLFGGRKKTVSGDNRQENTLTAQDVLVEDPVCHTYIPKKQAFALNKDEQTYYFCCEKCRETFITEEGDLK